MLFEAFFEWCLKIVVPALFTRTHIERRRLEFTARVMGQKVQVVPYSSRVACLSGFFKCVDWFEWPLCFSLFPRLKALVSQTPTLDPQCSDMFFSVGTQAFASPLCYKFLSEHAVIDRACAVRGPFPLSDHFYGFHWNLILICWGFLCAAPRQRLTGRSHFSQRFFFLLLLSNFSC